MGAVTRLLTYRQVAARYGVTTRTVRTWAAKGAVSTTRTPGGRPRVVEVEEGGSVGGQVLPDEDVDA